MIIKNIFSLYKTFDEKDASNFRDFLLSPYFNTNKKILSLYDEIIKYRPTFENPNLSKENLYRKIYRSGYNDSTIRNLFFRLQNLTESFLIFENFKKNPLDQSNKLLNELNRRRQKDIFDNCLKHIDKKYNECRDMNDDYLFYFHKFMLDSNKYNHLVLNDKSINSDRANNKVKYLNASCIDLLNFCVNELISIYMNSLSYFQTFNIQTQENFITDIIERINIKGLYDIVKGKDENDYILFINNALYEAFHNFEDETSYFSYKNALFEYMSKLSIDEKSFHFSRLITYCIIKMTKPDNTHNFQLELFNLYKIFLKEKYYIDNKVKHIPIQLFREILILGLRLKELDWVKYFINKFSSEVDISQRENMCSFGYAFYYYEVNEYELAMEYAEKVSFDYFSFKYDIKSLELRIYFETDDFENGYNMIHNYKEMLRREESMTDELKAYYKNFINYFEKLFWSREGKKKIDADYLRNEIIKTPNVMLKNWLLDKYEQLIQSTTKQPIKTAAEQIYT